MPAFKLFPLPFWLVLVALVFFAAWSWRQTESSLRVPMIAVLLTVTVWYVGDVLYNDYAGYLMEIDTNSLQLAWWEVLAFICSFGILSPIVHRSFNRKHLGRPSNLLSLVYHGGFKSDKFQNQLDLVGRFLFVLWTAMMIVALFRTGFDFAGIFMPYLGEKADPWGRARVGAGYDSVLAAAGYIQIGLTAAFGVFAALACRPLNFSLALIALFLTLPTYIFDRTRNTMLATILPGFLAFVFVRVRAGLLVKAVILIMGFVVMESWLKFVIENRDNLSIVSAFRQGLATKSDKNEGAKHAGLNMFEELGFINSYIADRSYRPKWGENYFSELVNPIPRTLWPGKPWIGIDYAVARGQGLDTADDDTAGVGATLSTGIIGQGVINFGRILGPLAAALLMAYWVAILARQDLLGAETGRLFLYAIGLILTFNMGRDITLLVIYPFLFGYLMLLMAKSWNTSTSRRAEAAKPKAFTTKQ